MTVREFISILQANEEIQDLQVTSRGEDGDFLETLGYHIHDDVHYQDGWGLSCAGKDCGLCRNMKLTRVVEV